MSPPTHKALKHGVLLRNMFHDCPFPALRWGILWEKHIFPQAAGSNNRVHTRRKSTEPTRENFSPLQLHLPKDFPSLMETNMENSELPFRFITTKGLVQKLPKMHQEAPDSNLPLSGWAKAEEHPATLWAHTAQQIQTQRSFSAKGRGKKDPHSSCGLPGSSITLLQNRYKSPQN